jgi:hypothetical protein
MARGSVDAVASAIRWRFFNRGAKVPEHWRVGRWPSSAKTADLLGLAEGVTFPRVLGIECVGVGDLAVAVPSARVESGF